MLAGESVDVGIASPLFSLVWKFMFCVGIGGLLTRAVVHRPPAVLGSCASFSVVFKIHCINSPWIE